MAILVAVVIVSPDKVEVQPTNPSPRGIAMTKTTIELTEIAETAGPTSGWMLGTWPRHETFPVEVGVEGA